jgi:hypothetical protein
VDELGQRARRNIRLISSCLLELVSRDSWVWLLLYEQMRRYWYMIVTLLGVHHHGLGFSEGLFLLQGLTRSSGKN